MTLSDIFMIDGKVYNVIVPESGIKRTFQVLDSENTTRTTTGVMIRDIKGTYYNYTIQVLPKLGYESDYNDLYEDVSSPEEFHLIKVPYGQEVLEFDAYVTSGEDTLIAINDGGAKWTGLSLQFVAKQPRRYPND